MCFAVVFRTSFSVSFFIIASACTHFPLPEMKLIADGFLSVQTLPERLMHFAPVSLSISSLITASHAITAMFMPMASFVSKTNLKYTFLPTIHGWISVSMP